MADRILVVEDDPEVEELVSSYFRARGREVTVVDTMERALGVIGRGATELVITDLKLPDGSGLELIPPAARLGLRVVVTTGYPSVEVAVAAWRAGADDFLCKPYRLRDLYAAVERASERGRRHREAALTRSRLELLLAAESATDPEAGEALVGHLLLVLSGLDAVHDARIEGPGVGVRLGAERSLVITGEADEALLYVSAVGRALDRIDPSRSGRQA